MNIALVGNPNSGKTTLFNQCTGTHQHVGNFPGITVEKKEGTVSSDKSLSIVDLPGIYSLSPYSKEEVVSRRYLAENDVDVILNIVDATNLERNLYLTEQLMEFGVPVVVALNMMDVVRKRGIEISVENLSAELGVGVVEISALYGEGIDELLDAIRQAKQVPSARTYSEEFEKYISRIESKLPTEISESKKRYYSIKAFEQDKEAFTGLGLAFPQIDDLIDEAKKEFDDETDAIVANERYNDITGFISKILVAFEKKETLTQKIDKVLTNRIAAIPIFIAVIALVYYIAIGTVGSVATDWANDGVFGEGWYLDVTGQCQQKLDDATAEYDNAQGSIEVFLAAAAEQGIEGTDEAAAILLKTEDEESASAESAESSDGKAQEQQSATEQQAETEARSQSDEQVIATFVANARAAELSAAYVPVDDETGEVLEEEAIFVDADEFERALTVQEPNPSDYGIWIPGIPTLIENGLDSIQCAPWVKSLVLDGIVAGVGAVLGFLPQIMILFFMLALLEGCGYMARVAFILDRIFRHFGLSGKTFIPMLIGTGCGVPGIMATRTIENDSARRITIMSTTFMPCSAKLPVISLFAGALFGGNSNIATLCYFVGVASIIITGIMLKKTKPFLGESSPFVMELPEYRLPRLIDALRSMLERAGSFIKKAGTIILVAAILIWFLSNIGFENGAFGMVSDMDNSLLAGLGSAIAFLFMPLGWGNWQFTAATVTGLIAKENLVGTLAVLYGSGDLGLWATLAATLTIPAGLSYMFFNLLCAPCFAAMGAIRREMNSAKWFFAAVGYQCGYAYCIALMIYQFGGLLTGELTFGIGSVVAIIILAFMLFMIFRPDPAKKLAKEQN